MASTKVLRGSSHLAITCITQLYIGQLEDLLTKVIKWDDPLSMARHYSLIQFRSPASDHVQIQVRVTLATPVRGSNH